VRLDLGDRYIQVCILDEAGAILEESRLPNKRAALERRFSGSEPLRIVLEAGTHSPWVSRLLKELGHDVLVANPRKLRKPFSAWAEIFGDPIAVAALVDRLVHHDEVIVLRTDSKANYESSWKEREGTEGAQNSTGDFGSGFDRRCQSR
jgi:hypothetical protein